MELFQSFWHGADLPRHGHLCLSSFTAHGDRYRLYAYRKFEVPAGIELADASQILPEASVFFYKNPDGTDRSVAAFANLFRYALLNRRGGWWVDTDVLRLDGPLPEGRLHLGREQNGLIGNAILKTPPVHPLTIALEERARAAGTDVTWGQTGPYLLTRIVEELGLQDEIKPFGVTYRTNYLEYLLATSAEGLEAISQAVTDAPFLHLWHEMFRFSEHNGLDDPEPGSFLARQYQAHMPAIS